MMSRLKNRVDAYISADNYFKVLSVMSKNGLKTISQTINYILTEYFKGVDDQKGATDRLNKVIQDYEKKVYNLEFEIRQLKNRGAKILKEK